RGAAEIGEIGRRTAGVFVIAERRARARAMTTPGGFVAVLEFIHTAAHIGIVTGGEDRARQAIQQRGGGFRARRRARLTAAEADVPRADEHRHAAAARRIAAGTGPCGAERRRI